MRAWLGAVLLVAACGGGDSNPDAPPTPDAARDAEAATGDGIVIIS